MKGKEERSAAAGCRIQEMKLFSSELWEYSHAYYVCNYMGLVKAVETKFLL